MSANSSQLGTTIPKLLTVAEAAEALRVSRRQVSRLTLSGALPSLRIGVARVVIPEEEITAYVKRQRELGR